MQLRGSKQAAVAGGAVVAALALAARTRRASAPPGAGRHSPCETFASQYLCAGSMAAVPTRLAGSASHMPVHASRLPRWPASLT